MSAGGVVVSAAAVCVSPMGSPPRPEAEERLAEGQSAGDGMDAAPSAPCQTAERTRHTAASLRMSRLVATLLRRAGLDNRLSPPASFGIVSGSHYGCAKVHELHQRLRQRGPRSIDPVYFAQATHSYPLSVCAIEHGFKGPCASVVGSYSAGLKALLCACDWLRDRRCEHVIVVAYEDVRGPILDHVQTTGRQGHVREAMALLCLERRQTVHGRGAPVLAELEEVAFLRSKPAAISDEHGIFLGASGIAELALILTGEMPRPAEDSASISAFDSFGGGVGAGFRLVGKEEALTCAP